MRKLRVVLELEVDDLPDAQREELAREIDSEASSIPKLKELLEDSELDDEVVNTIGDGLVELVLGDGSAELFAGSNLYLMIKSAVVRGQVWLPEE